MAPPCGHVEELDGHLEVVQRLAEERGNVDLPALCLLVLDEFRLLVLLELLNVGTGALCARREALVGRENLPSEHFFRGLLGFRLVMPKKQAHHDAGG